MLEGEKEKQYSRKESEKPDPIKELGASLPKNRSEKSSIAINPGSAKTIKNKKKKKREGKSKGYLRETRVFGGEIIMYIKKGKESYEPEIYCSSL